MQASVEAMLNHAMELNTEIQEDNLIMYERCNRLCERAKTVEAFERLITPISQSGIDKLTFAFLDKVSAFSSLCDINIKEALKLENKARATYVISKIKAFSKNERAAIGSELRTILDCSIKDLNAKTTFASATNASSNHIAVYNKLAYENLSGAITNIVNELALSAGESLSFEGLKDRLVGRLGADMTMINTKITNEGFVTMDVPPPEVQELKKADMSVESLNAMSAALNNVVTDTDMPRLARFTLEAQGRVNVASNLVDEVRRIHLLAQVLMSAKNSLMLIKNYHAAAINGSSEGFFSNIKDNSTM